MGLEIAGIRLTNLTKTGGQLTPVTPPRPLFIIIIKLKMLVSRPEILVRSSRTLLVLLGL